MFRCAHHWPRLDSPVSGAGVPILFGLTAPPFYPAFLRGPPCSGVALFWDRRVLGSPCSGIAVFWDRRVLAGTWFVVCCFAPGRQIRCSARSNQQEVIGDEPRTWPSLALHSTGPSHPIDFNRAGIFSRGRMEIYFGTLSLFAFGGRTEGQRGCQDCQ